MKARKTILSLLLVLAFSFSMLAGCGKSDAGVIKIGAVGPLTGDNSPGGTDELKGKQMAVDDVNAAGGINGKKVELLSEDDASSASQSAAAVTKLINQNKVVAVVGAFGSPCTLADLQVLDKYGIPMITAGSSAASVLASGSKWISRAFPGDPLQCTALINYIQKTAPAKKIGVIYINDDFGKGGLNAITAAAQVKGIDVVSESFAAEDKDMTAQLSKLKSQNIDCLFIWCNYAPGALVMKQARALNWNIQFYSGTGTIHPDTFSLSDNTYIGTINSVPFTTASTDPTVQDWVKRYQTKYTNAVPSQNSARAYDATMILLSAIKTAGSTDPQKIQDAIRNTKDYKGLQGTISIDPQTGEYIGDVMIVQAAQGGTWTYLDSASTK